MKLQYTEIKEEFEKFGCEFKMVAKNENNGIRVYRRVCKEFPDVVYFEVILPRPVTTENGSTFYRYPSTSEFGVYGRCINSKCVDCQRKINDYLKFGFR